MIRRGSAVACVVTHEDIESAPEDNRRYRQKCAKQFAKCCIFEGVRQHIVRHTGPELLPGDRMYYGVALAAVYGMDSSICVVTKRNEVDMTRFRGTYYKSTKDVVIGQIADAARSEIEGHAFDGGRETKPFGFVSVPVSFRMKSGEESGQKASRPKYDEEKAVDFLTRQMQSGLASSFDATIKTAIGAFKHLCLEELEAEELLVTTCEGPKNPRERSLRVNEIQNYLDIFNDDGSGRGVSDSRMDSGRGGSDSDSDMEPYEYSYMDVHSDRDDSYMDLDTDRFATEQEKEECYKLMGIEMYKYNKVKVPRQCGSVYFKCGGYRRENVSITCVGTWGRQFWLEEWYDLMWVAVHGVESICLVFRHNDLDMTRVGPLFKGFSKGSVMGPMTSALLSDIEDIPEEKRESSDLSINVPFGVVCLNPGMAHMDHQKDMAVAFLEDKMRNGPMVTVDETIQTAIRAFQHLCLEEVKAEDIHVCRCRELGSDCVAVSLAMHEIKPHLQVIDSGSSSSPPEIKLV